MTVELDHTIVCARDTAEAIRFYTDVVGLTYGGRVGRFEVIRVNDHLAFDLVTASECSSRHFAFVMDTATFVETFARIKQTGTVYGDGPGRHRNRRGPGRSTGTLGRTWSVYFEDPSGHLLEILTYDDPGLS